MTALLIAAVFTNFIWRAEVPEGGLKYEANGDHVKVTLTGVGGRRGGGDGYIAARIPLWKKGCLDFDVKITRPPSNRAMAEYLTFYGIRTYFHDSLGDWRIIRDQPNANRESGFADEPVRHYPIARTKAGEWHHIRIAFDYDADRADLYFDDMSDPAYISADMSVWSEQEYKGGELCIGGMGLSAGGSAEFRNLMLTEEKSGGEELPRTETLVFNGVASEYFQLHRFLKSEKPRVYSVDGSRRVNFNVNMLAFKKQPGTKTLKRAKRIVMVDVPVGPMNILPSFMQKSIVQAVKEGAELTFIEGPWSLDKGEVKGAPLAEIMPEGVITGNAFKPPVEKMDVKILEREVGKGKVRVVTGYRFPHSPAESVEVFKPYAEKLFK